MNDDEDWVMRPVMKSLCKYESLIDGTLSLFDIARMNEAIDVENENLRRAEEAAERNRNRS